jgi:hypothetical protein
MDAAERGALQRMVAKLEAKTLKGLQGKFASRRGPQATSAAAAASAPPSQAPLKADPPVRIDVSFAAESVPAATIANTFATPPPPSVPTSAPSALLSVPPAGTATAESPSTSNSGTTATPAPAAAASALRTRKPRRGVSVTLRIDEDNTEEAPRSVDWRAELERIRNVMAYTGVTLVLELQALAAREQHEDVLSRLEEIYALAARPSTCDAWRMAVAPLQALGAGGGADHHRYDRTGSMTNGVTTPRRDSAIASSSQLQPRRASLGSVSALPAALQSARTVASVRAQGGSSDVIPAAIHANAGLSPATVTAALVADPNFRKLLGEFIAEERVWLAQPEHLLEGRAAFEHRTRKALTMLGVPLLLVRHWDRGGRALRVREAFRHAVEDELVLLRDQSSESVAMATLSPGLGPVSHIGSLFQVGSELSVNAVPIGAIGGAVSTTVTTPTFPPDRRPQPDTRVSFSFAAVGALPDPVEGGNSYAMEQFVALDDTANGNSRSLTQLVLTGSSSPGGPSFQNGGSITTPRSRTGDAATAEQSRNLARGARVATAMAELSRIFDRQGAASTLLADFTFQEPPDIVREAKATVAELIRQRVYFTREILHDPETSALVPADHLASDRRALDAVLSAVDVLMEGAHFLWAMSSSTALARHENDLLKRRQLLLQREWYQRKRRAYEAALRLSVMSGDANGGFSARASGSVSGRAIDAVRSKRAGAGAVGSGGGVSSRLLGPFVSIGQILRLRFQETIMLDDAAFFECANVCLDDVECRRDRATDPSNAVAKRNELERFVDRVEHLLVSKPICADNTLLDDGRVVLDGFLASRANIRFHSYDLRSEHEPAGSLNGADDGDGNHRGDGPHGVTDAVSEDDADGGSDGANLDAFWASLIPQSPISDIARDNLARAVRAARRWIASVSEEPNDHPTNNSGVDPMPLTVEDAAARLNTFSAAVENSGLLHLPQVRQLEVFESRSVRDALRASLQAEGMSGGTTPQRGAAGGGAAAVRTHRRGGIAKGINAAQEAAQESKQRDNAKMFAELEETMLVDFACVLIQELYNVRLQTAQTHPNLLPLAVSLHRQFESVCEDSVFQPATRTGISADELGTASDPRGGGRHRHGGLVPRGPWSSHDDGSSADEVDRSARGSSHSSSSSSDASVLGSTEVATARGSTSAFPHGSTPDGAGTVAAASLVELQCQPSAMSTEALIARFVTLLLEAHNEGIPVPPSAWAKAGLAPPTAPGGLAAAIEASAAAG